MGRVVHLFVRRTAAGARSFFVLPFGIGLLLLVHFNNNKSQPQGQNRVANLERELIARQSIIKTGKKDWLNDIRYKNGRHDFTAAAFYGFTLRLDDVPATATHAVKNKCFYSKTSIGVKKN